MKKILALLASLLLVCGCSDAYANIKDGSTEVFKVGNKTITKEDMYSFMKANAGTYYVLNDATAVIVDKEIEITDDMRTEAEEALELYKNMYGESFTNMLESYGYKDEEDYLNNAILKSAQLNELVKKYATENYDSLVEQYFPRKAIILSLDSSDDADAALTELKGGTEVADVVKAYNAVGLSEPNIVTSDEDYPAEVKAVLISNNDGEWVKLPSSNGKYYLVQIVDSNPANFKEEFVKEIATNSAVQEASDHYYFSKYNFTIYDKDLYDSFKAEYENYLVQ